MGWFRLRDFFRRHPLAWLSVLALVAAAMLSSPFIGQQRVQFQSVRVLDAGFNEVANVRDPAVLHSLEELWSLKVPLEDSFTPSWTHKLDIDSQEIGGRWLYSSSEGYLQVLSMKKKKTYRLSDKEAFNAALGL